MINKISLFTNNIKCKTMKFLHNCTQPSCFKPHGLKNLKKDLFELKEGMPEVLMYNPPIIEGSFYTGIKDPRFAYFCAEYHAYNFEGYEKFPNKYVCIDSNGDRRLKPHVYLKYIEIKPEFARKGIYSNAVKKVIGLAKLDEECEGRIVLDARNVNNTSMTKIPSPSLAHWKNGFRFITPEQNAVMERVLKGELPLEKAPEGTMYFPLN